MRPLGRLQAHNKLAYYKRTMTDDGYLNRSLGFLLADVSRLLRKRFDARARTLGLTRSQWRVLGQLRRREGIKQTDLADLLEIEAITLARHIDRLEAKGFVERKRHPQDRRAWQLYLKDEVKPVLDRLRALSDANRQEALAGIPEADSEQLIETLLKIKANMVELETAASPNQRGKKKIEA